MLKATHEPGDRRDESVPFWVQAYVAPNWGTNTSTSDVTEAEATEAANEHSKRFGHATRVARGLGSNLSQTASVGVSGVGECRAADPRICQALSRTSVQLRRSGQRAL